MNSRERFLSAMSFNAPDTVPMPCLFQRFEAETIRRWQREGQPRDVHVVEHFGFERIELAPVSLGLLPAGSLADSEDAREWQVGTDREHAEEAVVRTDRVKETYPVREPDHWPALRQRLNPASPARYPRFWDDYVRSRRGRDYPLGIAVDGPFSSLREWMGLRGLARALQESRGWVAEMVEYLGEFAVAAAARAVRDLDLDFAVVRERSACRASVVASPADLGQLLSPCYRRLGDFLASAGVGVRLVEAPGNVADLIPTWVESGLNGLCFVEAGAGLDANALRRQYGRSLALVGNIDHQALATSRRDVADEIQAKVPGLLSAGGYIPTPDRPVSSEVQLEDYEYYLATLRGL